MKVEVKVVGMFDFDMVTEAEQLELPEGSTVGDALSHFHAAGAIDDAVYAAIAAIAPPNFLLINDEQVDPDTGRQLADGDVVAVLQMISGG